MVKRITILLATTFLLIGPIYAQKATIGGKARDIKGKDCSGRSTNLFSRSGDYIIMNQLTSYKYNTFQMDDFFGNPATIGYDLNRDIRKVAETMDKTSTSISFVRVWDWGRNAAEYEDMCTDIRRNNMGVTDIILANLDPRYGNETYLDEWYYFREIEEFYDNSSYGTAWLFDKNFTVLAEGNFTDLLELIVERENGGSQVHNYQEQVQQTPPPEPARVIESIPQQPVQNHRAVNANPVSSSQNKTGSVGVSSTERTKEDQRRGEELLRLGVEATNSGNYSDACEYFRKSAEAGNVSGKYNYANALFHGSGCEKDYDRAFTYAKELADINHIKSSGLLGRMYEEGKGTQVDVDMAIKYYSYAAKYGSASSAFNLGLMYYNGEIVRKDLNESLKWMKRSAELGNRDAEQNVRVLEKKIAESQNSHE